jgi:cobalt-zinc-cadmium efflux system membrane fusion protein
MFLLLACETLNRTYDLGVSASMITQTPPSPAARGRSASPIRFIILGVAILVAGVAITGAAVYYGPRAFSPREKLAEKQAGPKSRLAVELVEDVPHTLSVPERVRKALGIEESVVAGVPKHARPLVMPGSTALDPARVMRVKTRFNAEVVEVAHVPDPERSTSAGRTLEREIRTGDRVKKGDMLAVVWSTDVGGRKSDLVDALVQLRLDEKRLAAREELYKHGSLPEDTLNQTRRDVVSDRNARDRAERTLRTWNVPEREIQAVYAEADLKYGRQGKPDKDKERLWARSELVAPRDGTLVERNVSIGEYVADNTVNLFTIAEVDRLLVIANPPEDRLPDLLALEPDQMRWTIQTVTSPPIEGAIEEIGYLLDPNQHTLVVKGYIDNPGGELRAGQFVTATVNLPPPPGVVEVPLVALAEDGKQSFVFVQPDPNQPRYTMRRVKVTHRFEKSAFVRSRLTPAEEKMPAEESAQGMRPYEPLKPGERFIVSGVLELRSALEDKESKAR